MTTDLKNSGIEGLAPIAVGNYYHRATRQGAHLAQNLRALLGRLVVSIDPVGGTSVPNLLGRPTVDLLLITSDLFAFDNRSAVLTELGYKNLGDGGLSGQRLLRLGEGVNCEAMLYVYQPGDRSALQHLLVRDYLRHHPEEARRFGELKAQLADRHLTNGAAYFAGKRPRLQRLLEQATGRRWQQIPDNPPK